MWSAVRFSLTFPVARHRSLVRCQRWPAEASVLKPLSLAGQPIDCARIERRQPKGPPAISRPDCPKSFTYPRILKYLHPFGGLAKTTHGLSKTSHGLSKGSRCLSFAT